MQTEAEQGGERERKRGRAREVAEKELAAGGVESIRGMHRLRARINIILRLLTESRAEQPAGRLRITCLHLQKPLCALSEIVLHPPVTRTLEVAGRGMQIQSH